MIFKEVTRLIYKEILIEWRQQYAISGMILYLVSSIFVIYLAFNLKNAPLNPIIWNAAFWIVVLFTAVNSIAKSFIQETDDILLYYYTLCHPLSIILSKIIYNFLLMMVLITLGVLIYSLVLGNPVQNFSVFTLTILLAALGFATAFTMISSIASKASNSSTMMAILGFPVILPVLLLIIKLSKNAIDGLPLRNCTDEMTTLAAIIVIAITSSVLLFPYLWRTS